MEAKQSVEQSFRESLKDVVTVVQKLAPHCPSFEDLVSLLELALTNDGQLNVLMKIVTEKK